MSFRRFVVTCPIVVFALAAPVAFGDGPPTLVKVRLRGGRAVVGELIEQTPDQAVLRNLSLSRRSLLE